MKKRILAMLLALTMMVSCLPVVTLADTPEEHIHCDCGKRLMEEGAFLPKLPTDTF